MNIRIFLLLGLFFAAGQLQAQLYFQYGLLPVLNLNKKIDEQYKLNFKMEGRQQVLAAGEVATEYQLTDLSLVVARRTGLDQTLAGGYLIRFREGERIHRLIQQWTFDGGLNQLDLVHRVVLDQTFSPSEKTEFRLRYRASLQFPLSGQSLNEREAYLKINNEYLGSIQGGDYDLEVRLITALGFKITNNNKVELGLDNRLDTFLAGAGRLRTWSTLSWYRAF